MGHKNAYSGRLYLAKKDEEIYLDVKDLLQHQLEGIRFLYRQFKKKKCGVILNDPTGYGKTLQVVLFLKAIKHLLCKPIMILCSDHEKTHWLTHFEEFTDYGDGVLVEPPNLKLKKLSVCINTKRNIDSLMKREWSILIIDDDTVINDVLKKKKVIADYKIWLTSVDMKTNLVAYWKIFAWLFPEEENIENIIKESNAMKDSIAEQILIDAAMQNVVLRRVIKSLRPTGNDVRNEDISVKVSRKNKDETGTKVKRSRIIKNEISDLQRNDEEFVDVTRKLVDITTNNGAPAVIDNFTQGTTLIADAGCINNQREIGEIDIGEVKQDTCLDDREMSKCESSGECEIGMEDNASMEIESMEIESIPNASNHCDEDLTLHPNKNNESMPIMEIVNEPSTQILSKQIKEKTNELSKNKSIDECMEEIEQKALQKFKGSFLDSIF